MAKVIVDLTEATEGSVLLPKGAYIAKIADIENKQSKGKQNMINVKLTIPKKGTVYTNIMVEGPGAFKFIELINALGGVKGIEAGKKISFDTSKLVGKVVGIITDIDEYEGKERTNVSQFIPKDSVDEYDTSGSDDDEEMEEADLDMEEKPKKKSKKKVEPEEDDEFDLDIDVEDEEEEEEKPKKKSAKKKSKKKVEPEEDDEFELDF